MQKFHLKMNVEGQSVQGVVQIKWVQVGVLCAFVYFSTHLGAFWLSINLFPCCGIGYNL
jgi:hypothetical protein